MIFHFFHGSLSFFYISFIVVSFLPHFYSFFFSLLIHVNCRSQSQCQSVAARLLRLWVWIPPGAWMFVWFDCHVLSVRGLCDEPITHLEKSYRLWCVVLCDLETSWIRRLWPTGVCRARNKQNPCKLKSESCQVPTRGRQFPSVQLSKPGNSLSPTTAGTYYNTQRSRQPIPACPPSFGCWMIWTSSDAETRQFFRVIMECFE